MAQDTDSKAAAVCDGVHKLPPELIHHILAQLYNDKPSLRSCALVSRNWSSSASRHLFFSITIGGKTFPRFLSFIEQSGEHPLLCECVRRVCVRYSDVSVPSLRSLVSYLPRLQRLKFHGCSFQQDEPFQTQPSATVSLQEFSIIIASRSDPFTPQLFYELVNLFTHIGHLEIVGPQSVGEPPHEIVTHDPSLRKPEINALRVYLHRSVPQEDQDTFLDLAFRHLDLSELQYLHCTRAVQRNSSRMQNLFNTAANLVTLWINLHTFREVHIDWELFPTFQQCTKLKTLGFSASYRTLDVLVAVLTGAAGLLRTFARCSTASALTSIQFDLEMNFWHYTIASHEGSGNSWSNLSHAINDLRCAMLQVDVRIYFHPTSWWRSDGPEVVPEVMLDNIRDTLATARGVTATVSWLRSDIHRVTKHQGWSTSHEMSY